jgi:hypothetical protein
MVKSPVKLVLNSDMNPSERDPWGSSTIIMFEGRVFALTAQHVLLGPSYHQARQTINDKFVQAGCHHHYFELGMYSKDLCSDKLDIAMIALPSYIACQVNFVGNVPSCMVRSMQFQSCDRDVC